jgi:hypothetical protein
MDIKTKKNKNFEYVHPELLLELLPPAARGALFEKTPLRGGAFAVQ